MTNVLKEAEQLVSEDRQSVYGHPADDFAKVAVMTQPILESNIDPRLKHALYMCQVKIARLLNTPSHRDSIVDLAGYANTYAMVLDRIEVDESANIVKPREATPQFKSFDDYLRFYMPHDGVTRHLEFDLAIQPDGKIEHERI